MVLEGGVARLRVGDIEINGREVRIGGQVMTSGSSEPPRAAPAALAVRSRQELAPAPTRPRTAPKVPLSPGLMTGTGLSLSAMGAVATALFESPFFHGGFFLPVGMGLVALGVLTRRQRREEAEAARRREEAALAPELERVRALLSTPDATFTLEELIARLGLAQPTAVRALVRLRDTGEIEEELNTDTGEWFYRQTPKLPERRSLDLDSQLAELEATERSHR